MKSKPLKSYKEFRKFYWKHPELRELMEEKYREMQRECFLRGKCKKRKNKNKARKTWDNPKNQIDRDGICPDQIDEIVNVGFYISRVISNSLYYMCHIIWPIY